MDHCQLILQLYFTMVHNHFYASLRTNNICLLNIDTFAFFWYLSPNILRDFVSLW